MRGDWPRARVYLHTDGESRLAVSRWLATCRRRGTRDFPLVTQGTRLRQQGPNVRATSSHRRQGLPRVSNLGPSPDFNFRHNDDDLRGSPVAAPRPHPHAFFFWNQFRVAHELEWIRRVVRHTWALPRLATSPQPILLRGALNSMFNETGFLLRHFSRVSNLLVAKCLFGALLLSCLQFEEWDFHLLLHRVHMLPSLTSLQGPTSEARRSVSQTHPKTPRNGEFQRIKTNIIDLNDAKEEVDVLKSGGHWKDH